MKIETKQELRYVMDFYNIPFVPIKQGGRELGKVTNEMKYEGGFYKLKREYTHLAFELAFEQINDVINLKKRINLPFSAIDVYRNEHHEWVYPDTEGGTPRHHVYPRTAVSEKESVLEGTMDEVFVKHYKANNRLRYCNGSSYHFKDKEVEELYLLWLSIMPEARHFDLYYGNGIVD